MAECMQLDAVVLGFKKEESGLAANSARVPTLSSTPVGGLSGAGLGLLPLPASNLGIHGARPGP